jgi:hypothetical protein
MAEITATNNKLRLTATTDRIVINDAVFPVAEIDRVAYWFGAKRLNGAYMGTSFWLKVGSGATSAHFFMDSGSDDTRLEEGHSWWGPVADLLTMHVVPRIVRTIVASIDRGETVNFGGLGCPAADRRGLRVRRPFASPILWSDMRGTAFERGRMRILVANGDSCGGREPTATMSIGMEQWNSAAIPGVVEHYRNGS